MSPVKSRLTIMQLYITTDLLIQLSKFNEFSIHNYFKRSICTLNGCQWTQLYVICK